MLWHSDI